MKKHDPLEGALEKMPCNEIYVNINHLENGLYELKITLRNKVIAQIAFEKEN